MAKPTILIAPGSFSLASEYDALISHLASSGYEAFAYVPPPLPPNPTPPTLLIFPKGPPHNKKIP